MKRLLAFLALELSAISTACLSSPGPCHSKDLLTSSDWEPAPDTTKYEVSGTADVTDATGTSVHWDGGSSRAASSVIRAGDRIYVTLYLANPDLRKAGIAILFFSFPVESSGGVQTLGPASYCPRIEQDVSISGAYGGEMIISCTADDAGAESPLSKTLIGTLVVDAAPLPGGYAADVDVPAGDAVALHLRVSGITTTTPGHCVEHEHGGSL